MDRKSLDSELKHQTEAAARRLAERAQERERNIEILKEPGGLALADSPNRVAKRLDRLSRYYAGEQMPTVAADEPSAEPESVAAVALARAARCVMAPAGASATATYALEAEGPPSVEAAATVLEKIILTSDFVGVRYLDAGVAAARAVCRVDIRDATGELVGYGTGSLVSPRLLLTNHHVLPDRETAQLSAVELNYQLGLDGKLLQSTLFQLEPDAFFVADKECDFALVAVRARELALAPFGFNRLIAAEGKAIIGEFVTIVQHPRGEPKQVALRENQVVDIADAFVHYETDTEPGSSGSPVFNDQWEVVALHHASVTATDHAQLGGYLNEGIRVSRIMQFLGAADMPADQRSLVDQLAAPEHITVAALSGNGTSSARTGNARTPASPASDAMFQNATSDWTDGAVNVTLPLEVRVRLGTPGLTNPAETLLPGAEAIRIDPDYSKRRGYDAAFMGSGDHAVPLPTLPSALAAQAAINELPVSGQPAYVLPYHHFSIVLCRERRLAFFTAVNVDGATSMRLKREPDRWSLDPRVNASFQTGEDVYTDNPLDRGHLVRRLDPAWGPSRALTKLANDDTFHFTNCTPQHKDFNEHKTLWAGLEDYVLEHADNLGMKVCVFSGPVLADDDKEYRGVKLPRQFWKVVTMVRQSGALSATAYLLSQAELIAGLEVLEEDFSYADYRTFQVPVTRIEALTGLDFNRLRDHDPLARQEAIGAHEVSELEQLVL